MRCCCCCYLLSLFRHRLCSCRCGIMFSGTKTAVQLLTQPANGQAETSYGLCQRLHSVLQATNSVYKALTAAVSLMFVAFLPCISSEQRFLMLMGHITFVRPQYGNQAKPVSIAATLHCGQLQPAFKHHTEVANYKQRSTTTQRWPATTSLQPPHRV